MNVVLLVGGAIAERPRPGIYECRQAARRGRRRVPGPRSLFVHRVLHLTSQPLQTDAVRCRIAVEDVDDVRPPLGEVHHDIGRIELVAALKDALTFGVVEQPKEPFAVPPAHVVEELRYDGMILALIHVDKDAGPL